MDATDPAAIPSPAADAIVVAAGRSTRMLGADKLSAALAGRPLLAWTLGAVAAARTVARIVLVAAPDRLAEVSAAPWLPDEVVDVVAGGARRQESVHAGFLALERIAPGDDRVVLVHDGARPLVSAGLVDRVTEAAVRHGAAIPILPVAETLKRIDGEVVGETVDRTGLGTAQTPQGARRDLLRAAFEQYPADGPTTWTDEASLLEAAGTVVHVVAGEADNLKVTTPGDLALAEARLVGAGPIRSGIGHDSHPFGPGEPLVLGGVEIAGAPRLHGHSDGDVALHAIADALLGAAGLGDLGRLFPADHRTPRGVSSGELLRSICGRLAEGGWRPTSVDVTVIAARPRLAGHLEAMGASVARLLDLEASAVNIKASTGNLAGPEGGGRSISALAIAMVARR